MNSDGKQRRFVSKVKKQTSVSDLNALFQFSKIPVRRTRNTTFQKPGTKTSALFRAQCSKVKYDDAELRKHKLKMGKAESPKEKSVNFLKDVIPYLIKRTQINQIAKNLEMECWMLGLISYPGNEIYQFNPFITSTFPGISI